MLTALPIQSFSFKMSVENIGFPLPVKIEEDQKLFIDLDSEGNSPEDIVIEWHLEIRSLFGNYSSASSESELLSILKEYITAITERAIHFEDIVRLHEMVERHMEYIYWFYRDLDICFSDAYLDYMEHIMTFYVNLTLRVLLVLKKKIKITQKKVMDMTQKVIKRLSFYLLKSEYHIFHVMIRQTTTQVDGMIKDVMNILNSNICKQMFRNLYMHFLVLSPVRDMSDEAFCRAFILFENWKAFEDYKQNEKIDECIKNIFSRDVSTIKDDEFLSKILTPRTSIMSELMKVMGCDPSITKAYFDHIKSKRKVEKEILDDIGKLALEDALLSETELLEEEDHEADYMKLFNQIMGNTKYDLKEVVLDYKNERSAVEATSPIEETDILVLDTDSDSDVEIVSIIPSHSAQRLSTPTKKSRNSATKTQPVISFLESISVDVAKRKYGSRTFGNSNQNKTAEENNTSTAPLPSVIEDASVVNQSIEACLIIDDEDEEIGVTDANKDKLISENETVVHISEKEETQANNPKEAHPRDSTPEYENPSNIPFEPMVFSEIPCGSDVQTSTENVEIVHIPQTPDIVNANPDDTEKTSVEASEEATSPQLLLETQNPQQVTSSSLEALQNSNDIVSHVCTYSELQQSTVPDEKNDEILETPALNLLKSAGNVKVVVERIPLIEELSQIILIAGLDIEETVAQEIMVTASKSETEMSSVQIVTDSNVAEEIEALTREPIRSSSQERNNDASNEAVNNEKYSHMDCVENESPVCSDSTETCEQLEVQLNTLCIAPKQTEPVAKVTDTATSEKVNDSVCSEDSNECKDCNRTPQSGKVLEILNCDRESEVSWCRTATKEYKSTCGTEENVENVNSVDSVVNSHTVKQSEGTTPLDTGQDQFEVPLDTGQFDPNSPASPETLDISLKPSNLRGDERNMLRTVSDSLIRKGQPGEFAYPTPPGSEEEREKDSDDHAHLIYILPTKTFVLNETPGVHDYEAEPNNMEPKERLSDEEKEEELGANPSLGKSYEQIVKAALGSQNSTEDENETPVTPKKNKLGPNEDDDGNFNFDEMEKFLQSCDNEDFPHTNRKKRKRAREKTVDDPRPRKNTSARTPKRVKINDTPETHIIPASYDENSKEDVWGKNTESDSSSSSDNEDFSPNMHMGKRRDSPMPLSKHLSKRNGASTRIPLSRRLGPEKPPPLKGILKHIEQKRTDHPLHPVDNEPETVVIVLHQHELERGKRGSIEVKVYRKSFIAYKVPFDDSKLCDHRACVELDQIRTGDVAVWGRVSGRTRVYEEEMCSQPDKPMYKIVFDKNSPQLNSNDRKFYCDPLISSSDLTKNISSLIESDHEQGTVNSSNGNVCIMNSDPAEPVPESNTIPPPTVISPPCFSPSSNSSSEFSDPTNLIPYQDIERALQVVEPDKPEEAAYGLDCHVSNDGIKKKRSFVRKSTKNHLENSSKSTKKGRKPKNPSVSDLPVTPKKKKEVIPKYSYPALATLEEALISYANFYRKEEEVALLEENLSNKARSLHRIVKRFEQAIKNHRLGKLVDVEKLPVPPGYPPFPEPGWTSPSDYSGAKQDNCDSLAFLKAEPNIDSPQKWLKKDVSKYSRGEHEQDTKRRKLENVRKSQRPLNAPKYLEDYSIQVDLRKA